MLSWLNCPAHATELLGAGCWEGVHLGTSIAVILLLPVFVAVILLLISLYIDHNPVSPAASAKQSGRHDVMLAVLKLVLTLTVDTAAAIFPVWLQFIIHAAVAYLWVKAFVQVQPQSVAWVNHMRAALAVVYAWSVFALFVVLIDPTRFSFILTVFMGTPPMLALGWLASSWMRGRILASPLSKLGSVHAHALWARERLRLYASIRTTINAASEGEFGRAGTGSLSSRRQDYRPEDSVMGDNQPNQQAEDENSTSAFDDGHSSAFAGREVGRSRVMSSTNRTAVARVNSSSTTMAWVTHFTGTAEAFQTLLAGSTLSQLSVLANTLVKQSEAAYSAAVSRFPNDGLLRVYAAAFYRMTRDSRYMEMVQLNAAKKLSGAVDVQFFVYQRIQAVRNKHVAASNGWSLSAIERLLYDQYWADARRAEVACYDAMLHAWGELQRSKPDFAVLQSNASELHRNVLSARGKFERMMHLNVSPKLLFAFGAFLANVVGEEERGRLLLQRAGRLEAGEDTAARNAVTAFRFGERTKALAVMSESSAIVTASGDPSTIGQITQVNAMACRLLGRSMTDLVGSNVSTIMPRPISDIHNMLMMRYAKTGKGNLVGTSRQLLVLAGGNLVPVMGGLSEAPPRESDASPQFSMILQELRTNCQFIIFGGEDVAYRVFSASAGSHRLMGTSGEMLGFQEVSAVEFFPDIETEFAKLYASSASVEGSAAGSCGVEGSAAGSGGGIPSLGMGPKPGNGGGSPHVRVYSPSGGGGRGGLKSIMRVEAASRQPLLNLTEDGSWVKTPITRGVGSGLTEVQASVQALRLPNVGAAHILMWKERSSVRAAASKLASIRSSMKSTGGGGSNRQLDLNLTSATRHTSVGSTRHDSSQISVETGSSATALASHAATYQPQQLQVEGGTAGAVGGTTPGTGPVDDPSAGAGVYGSPEMPLQHTQSTAAGVGGQALVPLQGKAPRVAAAAAVTTLPEVAEVDAIDAQAMERAHTAPVPKAATGLLSQPTDSSEQESPMPSPGGAHIRLASMNSGMDRTVSGDVARMPSQMRSITPHDTMGCLHMFQGTLTDNSHPLTGVQSSSREHTLPKVQHQGEKHDSKPAPTIALFDVERGVHIAEQRAAGPDPASGGSASGRHSRRSSGEHSARSGSVRSALKSSGRALLDKQHEAPDSARTLNSISRSERGSQHGSSVSGASSSNLAAMRHMLTSSTNHIVPKVLRIKQIYLLSILAVTVTAGVLGGIRDIFSLEVQRSQDLVDLSGTRLQEASTAILAMEKLLLVEAGDSNLNRVATLQRLTGATQALSSVQNSLLAETQEFKLGSQETTFVLVSDGRQELRLSLDEGVTWLVGALEGFSSGNVSSLLADSRRLEALVSSGNDHIVPRMNDALHLQQAAALQLASDHFVIEVALFSCAFLVLFVLSCLFLWRAVATVAASRTAALGVLLQIARASVKQVRSHLAQRAQFILANMNASAGPADGVAGGAMDGSTTPGPGDASLPVGDSFFANGADFDDSGVSEQYGFGTQPAVPALARKRQHLDSSRFVCRWTLLLLSPLLLVLAWLGTEVGLMLQFEAGAAQFTSRILTAHSLESTAAQMGLLAVSSRLRVNVFHDSTALGGDLVAQGVALAAEVRAHAAELLEGYMLTEGTVTAVRVAALTGDSDAFELLLSDACPFLDDASLVSARFRPAAGVCRAADDGIMGRGLLAGLNRIAVHADEVLLAVNRTRAGQNLTTAESASAAQHLTAMLELYDPLALGSFKALVGVLTREWEGSQASQHRNQTTLTVCCVLVYATLLWFAYMPRVGRLGASLTAARSLTLLLAPQATGGDGSSKLHKSMRRVTMDFAAEQSWVSKAKQTGLLCGLASSPVDSNEGMNRLQMHAASVGFEDGTEEQGAVE